MARIYLTFCEAGARTYSGGSISLPRVANAQSEFVEAGSISSKSSSSPTGYGVASVSALDGPVIVSAGLEPVADTETGFLVMEGQTRDFAVSNGDRFAVIDFMG